MRTVQSMSEHIPSSRLLGASTRIVWAKHNKFAKLLGDILREPNSICPEFPPIDRTGLTDPIVPL
jgi:hypothetical protein